MLKKLNIAPRLFDPFVTLWAFLSQVLDTDKSCHNAVSRVIAWLASEDAEIPSEDTSAYCQARQRLPQTLLKRLFGQVAKDLEKKTTPEHLWSLRTVKVVDGSTVSMPDTPENQAAYPQSSNQAPGCGFPIAKIGALFSVATGAAVALVIDVLSTRSIEIGKNGQPFNQPHVTQTDTLSRRLSVFSQFFPPHDVKLARKLYEFLDPGDILLGDRAFCSYADFVFVQNYGCDAVFRKHQGRKTQMKRGKHMGSSDHLITWHKP